MNEDSDYCQLERFLVFAGTKYYPSGGIKDFVISAVTQASAKEELLKHAMNTSTEWAHIYDSHKNEIVYEVRAI